MLCEYAIFFGQSTQQSSLMGPGTLDHIIEYRGLGAKLVLGRIQVGVRGEPLKVYDNCSLSLQEHPFLNIKMHFILLCLVVGG